MTREAAPNVNTWSELHLLKILFLFIKRDTRNQLVCVIIQQKRIVFDIHGKERGLCLTLSSISEKKWLNEYINIIFNINNSTLLIIIKLILKTIKIVRLVGRKIRNIAKYFGAQWPVNKFLIKACKCYPDPLNQTEKYTSLWIEPKLVVGLSKLPLLVFIWIIKWYVIEK